MAAAAFDRLAPQYDELWSDSAIGRSQRQSVWRWIDPLFRPGDRVLDLGCGTGVDACHLMARGVEVDGVDASGEMVRVARARGVAAHHLPAEGIDRLAGAYDGAISNFGVLNCVDRLEPAALSLGRLIRPGGRLAICVMGPCCGWEILYHLRRWKARKAFRRWARGSASTSFGLRIAYPTVSRFARAFEPCFRLDRWSGIALFVPPSYVHGLSERAIGRLAAIDRRIAHLPALRAVCDHRLLVFTRV